MFWLCLYKGLKSCYRNYAIKMITMKDLIRYLFNIDPVERVSFGSRYQ